MIAGLAAFPAMCTAVRKRLKTGYAIRVNYIFDTITAFLTYGRIGTPGIFAANNADIGQEQI